MEHRINSCDPEEAASIQQVFRNECGASISLQRMGLEISREDSEISSARQLSQEIAERAEPFYQKVWADCSVPEQCVLFQLARHWLNTPNQKDEICELLRKGLVQEQLGYKVMNETFRDFVVRNYDPRRLIALQPAAEGESFVPGAVAAAVGGLVLIVVLALLFGQKDTLQSMTTYVTAAFGALAAAGSLLARSDGGSTPKGNDG